MARSVKKIIRRFARSAFLFGLTDLIRCRNFRIYNETANSPQPLRPHLQD